MSEYHDRTGRYLREHGGVGPSCPSCGQRMFAADDHGRFTCLCDGGGTLDTHSGSFRQPCPIPQVDVSGMSNAEKAQVPAFFRLNAPMTDAEAALWRLAAKGPDAMDDPEYWKAAEAVERERNPRSEGDSANGNRGEA